MTAKEQRPKLSIVIASYNRRELLQRCLESLTSQTEDPTGFEVLVADDGSSDGTAEMIEGFPAHFTLRTLQLENGGWARALNAGAKASFGRVCLFVDDDIIASPHLVAAHIAAHDSEEPVIGVGKLVQQPPDARDWFAHTLARGWIDHYEELDRRPADWTDCYGANLSVVRSAFLECGGFDTDLPAAVDLELCVRLTEAGCRTRYVPDAEAIHDDQKLMPRMLRDAEVSGVAHVMVAERHRPTRARLLDWAAAADRRELALRRFLIATRVPPRAMAAFGRLLPGEGRKAIWLHFVRKLAFWRSVRAQVDRDRWRQLTDESVADEHDRDFVQSLP